MINFFLFLLLLVGMFIVPWWLIVLLSLISLFCLERFWWVIPLGLMYDLAFSAIDKFYTTPFIFTVGAIASYLLINRLKKIMIIYD